MKNKKTLLIILLVLAALGALCLFHYESTKPIVYREHLEDVIVTVDSQQLTLGDLAVYIAHKELSVDEQAKTYDYYNPNAYWNLHIDGEFVKVAAKRAVMEQAIHDEIFYQMALEENLTLDEQEEYELECRQDDFWMDMSQEQQEALGVTREKLNEELRKAAMAEKYQNLIAARNNSDFEGYSIQELPYESLLEEHEYQVKKRLWNRLSFGRIILIR